MIRSAKTILPQDVDFNFLEFYAGRGNLSKCMKLTGMTVASFDVKYKSSRKQREKPYTSNAMDILSPSGFALYSF